MKKKILALEDDYASLKLLKEMLERYDYEVITASDGVTALDYAQKFSPQLAIVDVMLPNMNGYQVCERLRKIPEVKGIPIIVLTALNEDQHRIRAIEAGATDFLVKPFSRIELLTKIKALLTMQEEFSQTENFDDIMFGLLCALYHRNEAIKIHSRRVAYIAEQIAIRRFISANEISEMKKAIYLQDIGQLSMKEEISFLGNQYSLDHHPQLGYEILSNFQRPIIKNIIKYHHASLKSTDYPHTLEENVKHLINIVAICNRFDQILSTDALPDIIATLNFIFDEVNDGLWDKSIFLTLKDVATSSYFTYC